MANDNVKPGPGKAWADWEKEVIIEEHARGIKYISKKTGRSRSAIITMATYLRSEGWDIPRIKRDPNKPKGATKLGRTLDAAEYQGPKAYMVSAKKQKKVLVEKPATKKSPRPGLIRRFIQWLW
jgi:hypothetical protein